MLKLLPTIAVLIAPSVGQFFNSNPCDKKETCSACLQTEACAWCMQPDYVGPDGSLRPRCRETTFLQAQSRASCSSDYLIKNVKKNQCECEKPGNFGYEENSPLCNGVGTYKCGLCECPPDFFGQKCECSAENFSFGGDLEAGCRPDNTTSTLCNNRGDCECGRCECHQRENIREVVTGEYCECENFSCDRHNGQTCSGPDHGQCICGKCKCNEEWDVEGYTACECRASHDTCITRYGEHVGKICSGHGTCECGECKCEWTEDGQYAGRYCDECPTCPGKCETLKACVQCQVFGSGELSEQVDEFEVDKCSLCPFFPILVDRAEDQVQNDERLCTFFDADNCRFTFVYGYSSTGELQVWVETTKQCPVDRDTINPDIPGKGTVDISVYIGIFVINALSIFISM